MTGAISPLSLIPGYGGGNPHPQLTIKIFCRIPKISRKIFLSAGTKNRVKWLYICVAMKIAIRLARDTYHSKCSKDLGSRQQDVHALRRNIMNGRL
jgi:hypothetical protein